MGAWVPLERVEKKKLPSEMHSSIKARQEMVRESNEIIRKLLNNEMGVPKGKEEGLRRGKGRKRWSRVGLLKKIADRRGLGSKGSKRGV